MAVSEGLFSFQHFSSQIPCIFLGHLGYIIKNTGDFTIGSPGLRGEWLTVWLQNHSAQGLCVSSREKAVQMVCHNLEVAKWSLLAVDTTISTKSTNS